MKKVYRVAIKNTGVFTKTKATTELGAKIEYCQRNNFNYRLFANQLEVVTSERTGKHGK
jgi:nitric oxide synthase oxygenase domain/subunit